jgi:hypothetical protein
VESCFCYFSEPGGPSPLDSDNEDVTDGNFGLNSRLKKNIINSNNNTYGMHISIFFLGHLIAIFHGTCTDVSVSLVFFFCIDLHVLNEINSEKIRESDFLFVCLFLIFFRRFRVFFHTLMRMSL